MMNAQVEKRLCLRESLVNGELHCLVAESVTGALRSSTASSGVEFVVLARINEYFSSSVHPHYNDKLPQKIYAIF